MNSKLADYVQSNYLGSNTWIEDEINQQYHTQRIGEVFNNKEYLSGVHKVLLREDCTFKEKEFIVKKLVMPVIKSVMNFHSTYLLGNSVSFIGSENVTKAIQKVYDKGNYKSIDRRLVDKFNKYNDAYEYIYKDNDKIKSKIIASEDGYPIYNEYGEYIGFIEHWTDRYSNISYYNLYDFDKVYLWSNEGSELHIVDQYKNTSKSLPIHYHNNSDLDERYGEGLLSSIIPVMDEIEDLLSKMGDAVYTLSLSPLSVTVGQQLEGEMNKDMVGYNVNLEMGGDIKYINATMDYQSIKYYLDTIQNEFNLCAYIPSILGGTGNIANVSETSLKMLYQLSDVWAMIAEEVMQTGFKERYEVICNMLIEENKLSVSEDDYINFSFNYSRPQNDTEKLNNIKTQREIGAMSIQTAIELSPLTKDTPTELDRLNTEGNTANQSIDTTKEDKVTNKE